MATPNVPQSVAYTCNVCGITGYNWHDPCVVPPAHLNHETFSIYCHTCDATFRSPTSATTHLQIHNCFEVAPVTSTHCPELQNRIPETPNVSLATPRSDSQSSDGLPLAQRPPPMLYLCRYRMSSCARHLWRQQSIWCGWPQWSVVYLY